LFIGWLQFTMAVIVSSKRRRPPPNWLSTNRDSGHYVKQKEMASAKADRWWSNLSILVICLSVSDGSIQFFKIEPICTQALYSILWWRALLPFKLCHLMASAVNCSKTLSH
jgi:hypothetical protein